MSVQTLPSKSLLEQFTDWGDQQRQAARATYQIKDPKMPHKADDLVPQNVILRNDLKWYIHALSNETKHTMYFLGQMISTVVIAPFTLIGEIARLGKGSINAAACVKNIVVIPLHMIAASIKAAYHAVRSTERAIEFVSTGLGLCACHAGEKIVHSMIGLKNTVLSNYDGTRIIVYQSLGWTLLAAGAVFIPVAAVQICALPIIMGSIYGAINNQFTVRECPEYYTMGHYYDGTKLRGHAIRSNNLWIKPIITGLYATTTLTKWLGLILAAAGTLPYAAATLPVSLAAAMIGCMCIVALVASHLFAASKKRSIQKDLRDYAQLIDMEWNKVRYNSSWSALKDLRQAHINQKRIALQPYPTEIALFDERLKALEDTISSNIPSAYLNIYVPSNISLKDMAKWQANNARNTTGYICAGGGALIITVTSVFLRIFAL